MTDKQFEKKYININLQKFAGDDKTEKASPKRKQDARKKGQVLQSREISSALVLLVIFSSIRAFGGFIYGEIVAFTQKIFNEYTGLKDFYSINALMQLFIDTSVLLLKTAGPIMAVALTIGLIVNYAQVGFIFTFENLGFKLDKINPLKGFKRLFSAHSVVELIKAVIKISVVGYIAYSYIEGEVNNVLNLMSLGTIEIAIYIGTVAVNVAIRMCFALILLGILDYFYQWWEYEKSLKMTKQEVKEENKQIEGNPEIKSKIRQKQRQISMRRMMSEVPKADVIITNPTHFAIAIKYDAEVSSAPVVLAKGQDYIALRIKETAQKSKIEIVENKSLARTLYETVDIGQAIPPELYQAVAEVLAFVYSLKDSGRAI